MYVNKIIFADFLQYNLFNFDTTIFYCIVYFIIFYISKCFTVKRMQKAYLQKLKFNL